MKNSIAKVLGSILRVLKTPLKLWTQQQKLTALITGLGVVLAGLATTAVVLNVNEQKPTETTSPTVQTTVAPTTTEPTTEETTVETTEPGPVITDKVLELQALHEENPHTFGWITLPGTKVDEIVMFSPDMPDYYLYQTFEGKFSPGGTAYIDEACDVDPETQVLQIYAHNMLSGTHFATLFEYEKQSFWEKHPYFYFTTIEEARTYEVISAGYFVYYSAPTGDEYRFSSFVGPENAEEFDEHMQHFLENSVIDTGVTATYDDNLLMLVTCAYQEKNGRFVVLAKEVPYIEPEVE